MTLVMDLVAGDGRQILLALAADDREALGDREQFAAHIAFGGSLDPTWLDLFSEAIRDSTGRPEPRDFIDARSEINGPEDTGGRTIERVDPAWITAVARITDAEVDAVAGRWIELVTAEVSDLPREEKPWIRQLAAEIVEFARRADRAPDVFLAWSLG